MASSKTFDFWGNTVEDFNNKLVFIYKQGRDLINKEKWPGESPSERDLLRHIGGPSTCFMLTTRAQDNKDKVQVLSGMYLINGAINENRYGHSRLYLISIVYATNKSRSAIIKRGFRLKHNGINFVTGNFYRENYETKSSYWRGSEFCDKLIKLGKQSGLVNEENYYGDEAEEESSKPINENEVSCLYNIEQFIEAEFAIEEMQANQEPPFTYTNIEPHPHQSVFKQFFKLTMPEDDVKRLKNLKPAFLQLNKEGSVKENLNIQLVEIASEGKNIIIVAVDRQMLIDNFPKTGNLYLSASPILKDVRLAVVNNIKNGLTKNRWIAKTIAKTYQYPNIDKSISIGHEKGKKDNFNRSQWEGIEAGIRTNDYALVLGPPGTGKTTVISEWVKYFVGQGKKVLISSQNNKAVDNVLERISRNKDIDCVRVGDETRVSLSIKDLLIDNYAVKIQQKLAENIIDAINNIKSVLDYLRTLKTNLPDFGILYKKLPALHKSIAVIKNEIEILNKKIYILNLKADKKEHKISRLKSGISRNDERQEEFLSKTGALHFPFRFAKKAYYNIIGKYLGLRYSLSSKALSRIRESQYNNSLSEKEKKELAESLNKDMSQIFQKIKDTIPEKPKKMLQYYPIFALDIDINGIKPFDVDISLHEIEQQLVGYVEIEDIISKWKDDITESRQKALYSTLLSMVDVVGATCIGINTTKSFTDIDFDVSIIDESGQIQVQNLLVPLSRSPKAILVGDHKQLPPVTDEALKEEVVSRIGEENNIEMLEKSFFEILWDITPENRKVMLDTQYRCPKVISEFISSAFYENKYFAHDSMADTKPFYPIFDNNLIFIDTSQNSMEIRAEKKIKNSDGKMDVVGNNLETEIIIYILKKIHQENLGDKDFDIGIIAPYKKHVEQIRREINNNVKKGLLNGLCNIDDLVATVDSFQGQEKDIIIFSFTRSNENGTIGFLKDWRRLNVAMTRTKRQLIMIGDISTLKKPTEAMNKDTYENKFKNSIKYLHEYTLKNGRMIAAIKGENCLREFI